MLLILSNQEDQYSCLDTLNFKICPLFQIPWLVELDVKFLTYRRRTEQCRYYIGWGEVILY